MVREIKKKKVSDTIEEHFRLLFLPHQAKEVLQRCGSQVVFLDSTFGLNAYGYGLFVLLVRDEHGHGHPVAFMVSSSEDQEAVKHLLTETFKKSQVPDGKGGTRSAPLYVVIDQNAAEIAAVEASGAIVVFCYFHVTQAIQRQLMRNTGGLPEAARNEFWPLFNKAHKAETKDLFDAAVVTLNRYLDTLGASASGFKTWLAKNYLADKDSKRWAVYGHPDLPVSCFTNNILERFNKSLKYTFLGSQINRRISSLVEIFPVVDQHYHNERFNSTRLLHDGACATDPNFNGKYSQVLQALAGGNVIYIEETQTIYFRSISKDAGIAASVAQTSLNVVKINERVTTLASKIADLQGARRVTFLPELSIPITALRNKSRSAAAAPTRKSGTPEAIHIREIFTGVNELTPEVDKVWDEGDEGSYQRALLHMAAMVKSCEALIALSSSNQPPSIWSAEVTAIKDLLEGQCKQAIDRVMALHNTKRSLKFARQSLSKEEERNRRAMSKARGRENRVAEAAETAVTTAVVDRVAFPHSLSLRTWVCDCHPDNSSRMAKVRCWHLLTPYYARDLISDDNFDAAVEAIKAGQVQDLPAHIPGTASCSCAFMTFGLGKLFGFRLCPALTAVMPNPQNLRPADLARWCGSASPARGPDHLEGRRAADPATIAMNRAKAVEAAPLTSMLHGALKMVKDNMNSLTPEIVAELTTKLQPVVN
ncbi:MAG: hypothetical protein ACOYNM_18705, partial [Gemmataceae bacterium]